MLTKGIVEDIISPYEVIVRIPILNSASSFVQSTASNNLTTAIVCGLPSTTYNLVVGDIVIIGFEDNDYGKPIILGFLVKEKSSESNINLDAGYLNVSGSAKLSKQTTIGDIQYTELQNLSGLGENVQNTLTELEDNVDTLIERVDGYSGNIDTSKNLNVRNTNPHLGLTDTTNDGIYYIQAYNDTNHNISGVGIGSGWANSVIIDANGHLRNIGGANLTLPAQEGTLALGGYSTSELVIGKWIDNKVLYRKVVDYTGDLGNNTEIEVGDIGAAISSVIDIKQTSTYTPVGGNNSAYDMYYGPATGTHSIIGCRVDLTTGKIYACSVNDGWVNTHLIIIVEYTKA